MPEQDSNPTPVGRVWEFGDFVFDTVRYELRCNGEAISVEPQVFSVMTHLIQNRDRLVTKEELFDVVWGGRFVTETALTSRIKMARRVLNDDGDSQRYIRTIRGRGYQFVGIVDHAEPPPPTTSAGGDTATQHVSFCHAADGVRLAYAVVGEGPPLVRAANWMTNLAYDFESPVWRHWVRDLARDRQLIRYDERGCGLSDWDVGDFTIDDWVTDLETVVDALNLDRFPLLGLSQGGAVAIAYAARHPDRVSRLILCSAYARGRAIRATTEDEKRAADLDLDLARVGWGRDDPAFRQVFAAQFQPSGTRPDWDAFDRLQRRTTSPDNAVRFLEEFARIDVRDAAVAVSCPTLVMHGSDDHRVPLRFGEELAALIPNARLVTLASDNHLIAEGEPAWQVLRSEVREFLSEDDYEASQRAIGQCV